MTKEEIEAYEQDKKLDIVDSEGIIKHYNMNDYGWLTHAQGYQSFVDKYIDDEEINKLASSDNVMDYYKIEWALICKQGYFSHKSWIDEGKIYHHFCFPKRNISLAQKIVYEKMCVNYNCIKDNL